MDPVVALEDFRRRITNYEKAYETIGDYEEDVENVQYCKVFPVVSGLLTLDD
jgi:6-phosphofructo-2-kinase